MVDVQLSTADKGIMMIDRYTKILLKVIAINLTIIFGHGALKVAVPEVVAQQTVPVRVVGGTLDYETDLSSGPTLKVCTQC